MQPMMRFPAEEAPIREWCRPLSATCGKSMAATSEGKGHAFGGHSLERRVADARALIRKKHAGGPPPTFNDEQARHLATLQASGLSYDAIARQYGTSRVTVWNAIQRGRAFLTPAGRSVDE